MPAEVNGDVKVSVRLLKSISGVTGFIVAIVLLTVQAASALDRHYVPRAQFDQTCAELRFEMEQLRAQDRLIQCKVGMGAECR